jgi:uncharacterized protein with FMN-binding domain
MENAANVYVEEPAEEVAPVAEAPAEPAAEEPTPVVEAPAEPAAPAITGNFTPGTHSGSAAGFYGAGSVNVTVTVSEQGYITNIALNTTDTEMFVDMARAVIPAIISAQSTSVAVVSGATATSNGIMQAVGNAVN